MRRIAVVVAIVAVLGLAFAWFSRPKPIPVVLKEVAEGKVEATLANTRAGTVEACQRTKLSTIIGGRIEYLGVKEGDRVRKGQLLLKLWNDDQQAQATGAHRSTVCQRGVAAAGSSGIWSDGHPGRQVGAHRRRTGPGSPGTYPWRHVGERQASPAGRPSRLLRGG